MVRTRRGNAAPVPGRLDEHGPSGRGGASRHQPARFERADLTADRRRVHAGKTGELGDGAPVAVGEDEQDLHLLLRQVDRCCGCHRSPRAAGAQQPLQPLKADPRRCDFNLRHAAVPTGVATSTTDGPKASASVASATRSNP